MKKAFLIFGLLLCRAICLPAQDRLGVYAVGFYNLENLFDTEDDPQIWDEEFTPSGSNAWTPVKYAQKLDKLSTVISQVGKEHCPAGLALLGVSEIENRRVLEDLAATPLLSGAGYEIVHYDSPDRRGVDVALLYNPKLFTVLSSAAYPLRIPEDSTFYTRDQLLVSGMLAGEQLHVIVNHWPSRRGGKQSDMRERAAALTKHIVDSLYRADERAKIIILGDLNDNPDDKSCKAVLKARGKQKDVLPKGLFNVTWEFWVKGIGSICYQGKWNLFDQMIVSYDLLGKDYSTLKLWKGEIFNREFLMEKAGRYKGYPFRTFSGGVFQNGYSDHLPVLLYLVKRL